MEVDVGVVGEERWGYGKESPNDRREVCGDFGEQIGCCLLELVRDLPPPACRMLFWATRACVSELVTCLLGPGLVRFVAKGWPMKGEAVTAEPPASGET
ncbi:hypothetical protein GCM10022254_41330 [Actinomadura meridiana]|uniref:Uncharacterized protein n=1 Tax=Actinomadura meridiana TaxID=559626 RepID=A0ABP8C7L4_9ACTN